MAIIKTKNFEILESTVEDDEYFECDELIAPTISVLNKKGYKTLFCCSGHAFVTENCCEMMLLFNDVAIEDAKPGIYDVKVIDEAKRWYTVKFRQYVGRIPYILFDDESIPPTLPDGWILQGNDMLTEIGDEDIDKPIPPFEFFAERLKVMKDLYDWANNLPDKNA